MLSKLGLHRRVRVRRFPLTSRLSRPRPNSPQVPTSPTQLGIRSTPTVLRTVTTQPRGGACVVATRKHARRIGLGREKDAAHPPSPPPTLSPEQPRPDLRGEWEPLCRVEFVRQDLLFSGLAEGLCLSVCSSTDVVGVDIRPGGACTDRGGVRMCEWVVTAFERRSRRGLSARDVSLRKAEEKRRWNNIDGQ